MPIIKFSLLPHPGIVGVDQERGPEKVEEGEEEDPVWLLSENSNPVGGKLVSLSEHACHPQSEPLRKWFSELEAEEA